MRYSSRVPSSDDHQRNAEFENIGDTLGNGDAKNNDQQSREEKRCRVTQAPKRAHPGRPQNGPPFADDGGNSGEVVRFGGVLQPKRKTKTQRQQNRILHCDGNLTGDVCSVQGRI